MISILFLYSGFWLENGEKTSTFLKSLGTIGRKSKFAIDQDLLESTKARILDHLTLLFHLTKVSSIGFDFF